MENGFVFGLDDSWNMNGVYQPKDFAGLPDLNALGEIQKSMTAGHPVPTYSGGGTASPLFKQEIVDQLFMQCETEKLVKFFPEVYKNTEAAKNTVIEYRKQTSVGSEFADVFQDEASAGQVIDSEFALAYTKMRWISEKRAVSLQSALVQDLVGNIGGAVAKAMTDASSHISIRLEDAMFHGDSTVNTRSFDGLKRIVTANNASWQVIDKRNTPLLLEDVGNGQESVYDNVYGRIPTKLWTAPRTAKLLADEHGDRVKAFYNNGQAIPPVGGQSLSTYVTQLGAVNVDYSFYLSAARKKLVHTVATHTTAPATPTITSTVAVPDAASKFAAADAADYVYKVVAIGDSTKLGASAPVSSNATTVNAGDKVTLTIAADDNTGVTFHNVYRHLKGETTWYLIGQVACTAGAPSTFVDYNEEIPGCADAYLYQPSAEVLQWRQMMPYSMIKLPQVDLKQYYAFAMFGTLICPIPAILRFKNLKVS